MLRRSSSSKRREAGLLDPYEVGSGWFRLVLPTLRVELTDAVPADRLDEAKNTLQRLKLDRHPKVRRLREEWLEFYRCGELQLSALWRFDPMLADALEQLFAEDPTQLNEATRGFREMLEQDRTHAGAPVP